jgi:uncharacterized protein (TIGR00106 family)
LIESTISSSQPTIQWLLTNNCAQISLEFQIHKHHLPGLLIVVLLEFSVSPLGAGESVSPAVAKCLEIVEQSGLDYQLHAMGTLVEGDLNAVLEVLRRCIEAVAADHPRVTCSAKLDLLRGHSGRLQSKVASVERQLGRQLKKSPGAS